MKKIITLVLALVIVCAFAACGDTSEQKTKPETASFTTSTDYADLKYPEEFKDDVDVDVDKDKVTYRCDGEKLFTVYFDSDKGDTLGYIDGKTRVSVKTYDVKDEDADKVEAVNCILDYLQYDYDFTVGEMDPASVEEEEVEVFAIQTSLVKMYYPTKWKDKVDITVKDKSVSFKDGDTKLFTLYFGGYKGYLLGTYDGTEIRIVDYEIKGDEQAAMQEDVNVILQYLMEDKKFEINLEN